MSDDHDHVEANERWKHDGVRVIRGEQLDANTAQTPGMFRQAAINHARVGAQKIWAGTVSIAPDAKTGVHHHGALESVIYVVRARRGCAGARGFEFVAEAGPGDFIFVPPYVPHQEINADPGETLECVLVRSDNEAVVVNIPMSSRSRNPRRSTGSIRSTGGRDGVAGPSRRMSSSPESSRAEYPQQNAVACVMAAGVGPG